MKFPSVTNLNEAHERIAPFVHKTPVLTCRSINRLLDCELFFKCENFQKAGAFKSNGEARRMLKENAVSINKEKINEEIIMDLSVDLKVKRVLLK